MIFEKCLIFTGATSAGALAFIDPSLVNSLKDGPAILLIALLFGAQMYLNKISSDNQSKALSESLRDMNNAIRSLTEQLSKRPCAWTQEHQTEKEKQ